MILTIGWNNKNKEESMSQRKRSGKWHYRFKYKGQEYTGSTDLAATPQNMREAGEIEAEALRSLKKGKLPTAKIEFITFRDAVQKFLLWAEAEYRAHPNSFKRIRTSLSSALEKFNKAPVSAIDGAEIDDYKTWRATKHEVRDITIRHDLHALSVFFAYAIRHHWASSNPIEEVKIPSDAEAERIHVLTYEEESDYFRRAAKHPDLFDVGRIMVNQGCRPEEVTQLAKKDVNLETNKLFVCSKTRAGRRHLDMTAETREILERRMKGDSPWIFPSKKKRGSHIGRINSAHDRLVAEAAKEGIAIDYVPYDLRHTFATRAAQAGIDLPTLASLLGHGSTRCLHKYVHPTAEHKSAAMKRFDRAIRRGKQQSRSPLPSVVSRPTTHHQLPT
jgi:integrase